MWEQFGLEKHSRVFSLIERQVELFHKLLKTDGNLKEKVMRHLIRHSDLFILLTPDSVLLKKQTCFQTVFLCERMGTRALHKS